MDIIIEDFRNMRILEPDFSHLESDFSHLQIVPSRTHSRTHSRTPTITTKQLICALYFENQQLKQQIEQLKALIQSQQVGLPHWVK